MQWELGEYRPTREKAMASAAAGNPPDIAMGDYWGNLAAGDLLDCKPFIDRDGPAAFSWDQLFPWAKVQGCREPKNAFPDPNGGAYRFPWSSLTNVVFVNLDLLKAAGLELPKEDWSWEDMALMARKLTVDNNGKHPDDAGYDPKNVKVYGMSHANWSYMYLGPARIEGVDILKSDFSVSNLRDKAWVKIFNWLDDLVNKYNCHPGGVLAPTGAVGTVTFPAGTIAMDMNMSWNLDGWVNTIKTFKWTMVPIPKWNGKRITMGLADGQLLWKGAKNHEAAWTFIKWFEGEECNRDYMGKIQVPVNKKIATSDAYWLKYAGYNPIAMKAGLQDGLPTMADRAYDNWAGIADQAIGGFNSRDKFKTAEEALDWAAKEIDRVRAAVIVK
jgi:ABC-type glycerol-3-phosphate transport system substrate-binding protein